MTVQCRDWQAWINAMPPLPDDIHVIGDVVVGNPGIQAILTMHAPQESNLSVLTLDLHLSQLLGLWPQVLSCAQARFDRIVSLSAPTYTSVEIFTNGQKITTIEKIPIFE